LGIYPDISAVVVVMAQACRPLVFWGQSREYIYIKVDITEVTSVSSNLLVAASLEPLAQFHNNGGRSK